MPSEEIEAMGVIDDILGKIEDKKTHQRILQWAIGKYATQGTNMLSAEGISVNPIDSNPSPQNPEQPPASETPNEIPGIAIHDKNGNIQFTFRDLKAKSAKDAAVRLTLVSTYVYEKFTGEKIAPRQKILTPLLNDWRINNGSSRLAIINHRGVIADGRTKLTLDSHAKQEAQKIMKEILDDTVKGKWNPSKVGKKATKKTTKKKS